MAEHLGTRSKEAWIAFRENFAKVLEARGMKVNDVAKTAVKKKRASSKTIYNVARARHPPKLASLQAVADTLDVPLWVLMIPGLPVELLAEAEMERLQRLLEQYVNCDKENRLEIADSAKVFYSRYKAKQGP